MTEPTLDDKEIAAYIDTLPPTALHSTVADAVLRRFGAERAWTPPMVADYRIAKGWRRGAGRDSMIECDHELRALIDDRIGMPRMTLDRLRAECLASIGRAPSRSALHRYIQRRQKRADAAIAGSGKAKAAGSSGVAALAPKSVRKGQEPR